MNTLSKIKDNFLFGFLIALLVLAFGAFVSVLLSECIEMYISKRLGLSFQKNETLKFLGISMGGILIALQALMSYRRAKAMEDAVEKTEQGQQQDRLKNAIEHLGHKSESVRLGGAYELFHLAKDTKTFRQTVLDILCAHIRQTTGASEYRETCKSEPSEEIQSVLKLLFVQEREVFKGRRINLQGSWLNGVNLMNANLQGANLVEANLQGANLIEANLQGANLIGTNLQGASLAEALLHGSFLYKVRLHGATLLRALLHGATLSKVYLQEADLSGVHLQGIGSENDILDSFAQRVRRSINRESDLSEVIFAGGLSQEDVASLVKDLSDDAANKLLGKLTPHIDQPASNQLPNGSDAITAPYTREEAEQWISEYEQAMPEGSSGGL